MGHIQGIEGSIMTSKFKKVGSNYIAKLGICISFISREKSLRFFLTWSEVYHKIFNLTLR